MSTRNPFRSFARRLGVVGLAAAAAVASGSAVADDTEIFFGPTGATLGRPNILFLIDTSGSMSINVLTTTPYDPLVDYAGTCRDDRVYWQTGAAPAPPRCTTTQWVEDDRFLCRSAMAALSATGFSTQARTAQWKGSGSPKQWEGLVAGRDTFVDCAADAAIPHGSGDSDELYAANGSRGPWSDRLTDQINWSNAPANGTYTYYTGNYVNWYYGARTSTRTRLQIVQEVVNQTLDGLSGVNVGLMRFDSFGEGGMVLSPVAPIETSLATIKTQVNGLTASGVTPLHEAYHEAASYLRGGRVDYGDRSNPVRSVATSRRSGNPALYQSPITSDCQKTFIVVLTDGLPNQDWTAEPRTLALPGFATTVAPNCGANVPVDGGAFGLNATSGRCLDDLAEYLYKTDNASGSFGTNAVAGVQNITTYTIGFGPGVAGSRLLVDAARRGGGEAYDADDTATLTSVLQTIIRGILTQNTFFTSPAISVNAFNRTRNLNDLFITMFQSQDRYRWPGNLKKYRIRANGDVVGMDDALAVDPGTGFFKTDVSSFWRQLGEPIDGANVEMGGAAARQPLPTSRNLYTNITTGDLTVAGNRVTVANASITPPMVGAAVGDTVARDQLIQYARGADVDDGDGDGNLTEARLQMGDPLHAQPVTVIYGGTAGAPNLDDAVVLAATNDGYLHAVDPRTGEELWAFMPRELLPKLPGLRANANATFKYYGLDGNLRVYRHDANGNGVVEPGLGDRVLLAFGMGRGGSSYYGLDITNKTTPRLLWRLTPAELPGLGQTWSSPTFAKVNVGGATQNALKLVAIFGGGYDQTQDNPPYNTDDVGNRVFMVDAVSGALLWRAGPAAGFGYDAGANLQLAKLNNSIPADIRVLDMSGDGFADRMYATDTGARIWRFDIFNGQPAGSLVTGGVFASLGVADGVGSSPQDARRFYYAPDLALMRENGRTFITVSVGSGFRGSPLNTQIRDRFYSLRDFRPTARLTQAQYDSWTPITDVTPTLENVSGIDDPVLDPAAVGWKMDLTTGGSFIGEKALAEARTFGGQVFFTTYTPNPTGAASCSITQGTNRLYVVSALTGGRVRDRASKVTDLPSSGIASNVVFVFPSPDDPADPDANTLITCTGGGCPEVPKPRCLVGVLDCGVLPELDPVRTFWSQRNVDE